jgi:capsular polysaccharide biosynthesis protein
VTLSQRIRQVRVWLSLGLACALIGAAIAGIVAAQAPARYTSQVSMLVGPPLGGQINSNDIAVGQALRQTFADLSVTRPILEKVLQASRLDITPEALAGAIQTRSPVNSSLLIVAVTWTEPADAALLANNVAQELVTYLENASTGATSNVSISVVDPAVAPTRRENAGPLFSAALGAGIGIVFAICVAFLVENLRPRLERDDPA